MQFSEQHPTENKGFSERSEENKNPAVEPAQGLDTSKTAGNLEKADFITRFIASLIDGVILFILSFGIAIFFGDSALSDLLDFITAPVYSIGMWLYANGATLGKKAMRIKIVKVDGSSIGPKEAALRYIGYIISALGLCLGYLWIIWDNKRQGWHDKIAGTLVVKE